jgi:DegV family protein with EDD domain
MAGQIVVVTDSTASLPARVAAERGIRVVPLQVVIGAQVYDEVLEEDPSGDEHGATPAMVAEALKEFRPVSTSRPTPRALLDVYERAAAAGASEIVSVHLSAEMSGTFESAQLAAKEASVPVHPVDSRQVGIATGYAALSAVDVLDAGGTAEDAVVAALARAGEATSLFYVDTLEYLRRGGRIGAAAALFGGALAVKPLLSIRDGKVATLEKVRTSGRALSRLADLVVEAAGDRSVDLCVSHLAAHDRAEQLAMTLGERLAGQLEGREVWCTELGAVLGAHVGPGMVAVCVAPRPG